MFNWRKNKKEDKFSDSDAQAQTKKNGDVTFHTMQDDLNAPKEKIPAREWGKDEKDKTERKKEKSRSKIYYDKEADKAKKDTNLYNPFLDNTPPTPKPFTIPPKSLETAKAKNISKQKSPVVITEKHNDLKINRGTVLKIFTFLSTIVAISLGVYLFWIARNPIEIPHESAPLETQNSAEETVPAEIFTEKYSLENPNYLSIDTESVSAEDIAQLLIQTASETKESKNDGPFEFIVTDANNNPLSFPIFTYLSKMNISKNALNGFDESFSLYFYRDGDNMRTGLAIDINSRETTTLEFAKEENSLAEKLQPLFLGCSFIKTDKSFNTGQYKDFSVHYLNLDEENNLSIDYAITENQLIIGFGKNTTRAIIDKIETEQSGNSTVEDDTDVDIEL